MAKNKPPSEDGEEKPKKKAVPKKKTAKPKTAAKPKATAKSKTSEVPKKKTAKTKAESPGKPPKPPAKKTQPAPPSGEPPKVRRRRSPLGLDGGPSAAVAIQLGGGTLIKGQGGEGTVAIACIDNSFNRPQRVLLTASHVIDRTLGSDVKLIPGGKVIGKVFQDRPGAGIQVDAATIAVVNDPLHRDVIAGGKRFPIRAFAARVEEGDTVVHGGPHGNQGSVDGIVDLLDAGPVTLASNGLSGEVNYNVSGLMKIRPLGAAFGEPGDSGSPVMMRNNAGTHDLVGLLVAVDGAGFGYAQHLANQNGVPGLVSLMRLSPLI